MRTIQTVSKAAIRPRSFSYSAIVTNSLVDIRSPHKEKRGNAEHGDYQTQLETEAGEAVKPMLYGQIVGPFGAAVWAHLCPRRYLRAALPARLHRHCPIPCRV